MVGDATGTGQQAIYPRSAAVGIGDGGAATDGREHIIKSHRQTVTDKKLLLAGSDCRYGPDHLGLTELAVIDLAYKELIERLILAVSSSAQLAEDERGHSSAAICCSSASQICLVYGWDPGASAAAILANIGASSAVQDNLSSVSTAGVHQTPVPGRPVAAGLGPWG